ncbi:helix-turn-helix domain-containing protein [Marinomonas pollencensis]|uniref:AraC family transcriptional regulator n=1 Tax=Marinomonas pollencensis TaxID=491954 RepID=A0A3E0DM92_9GAMM|nr:helix-turn-helix domain-containing protein [Marinomonas pollencensis]REG82638.1 AraC family transcriptional regulator [Marinomonas pollencensis]
MTSKHKIPHFALYGESNWIDDPEFFHIEAIESRSSDLGWKIKPHRHAQLFQILLLKSGKANIRIDDQQQNLLGSWAIMVPVGVVHSFQFAPDTDGRVITIAVPVIDDIDEATKRFIKPLLHQPSCISFNNQDSLLADLWPLIEQLEKELHRPHEGRGLMCRHLIHAILLQLARQQTISGEQNTTMSAQDQQIQSLKALIELHYKEHWSSDQYACALGMSISRLNRACKLILQQSVHDLIQSRLQLEAKRQLLYSRQTIEEIAYHLGFKDPGYFSRFFKKSTGYPPGRFRAASQQPIQ